MCDQLQVGGAYYLKTPHVDWNGNTMPGYSATRTPEQCAQDCNARDATFCDSNPSLCAGGGPCLGFLHKGNQCWLKNSIWSGFQSSGFCPGTTNDCFVYELGPACSPSAPPPLPASPPPSQPLDGAVLELTGTQPKILFGPQDAPVCSLSLDSAAGSIISTCELTTVAERRLEDSDAPVSRAEHEALKAEHEALKAEVTELHRSFRELAK